ncbi:MAG: SHOCT-like domain-containing protein [Anaerolineales bacterium]
MTDQEREQVLKMIESGKITAEDGLKLMHTLDQNPAEEELPTIKLVTGTGGGTDSGEEKARTNTQAGKSSFETDPRIEKVKSAVRRLWQIPLWIGIFITILSAWGMYMLVRVANINFWFYFLSIPLLLGVLLIAAAVGSRKARWLFVDVHQKPGDKPARIFLGFPLPLKLAAGFLRIFGRYIPDLRKTNVDEVIQVLETGFTGDSPLVVNVDEGENGERVQVYIG